MKIYHYNNETGVFLGEGVADPSPLEPGVWLIPAQAVTQQPPTHGEGQQAVWTGENWAVKPIPEPEPEQELAQPPEQPLMTPEQKLAAAGLTISDLRQLLGLEVTP